MPGFGNYPIGLANFGSVDSVRLRNKSAVDGTGKALDSIGAPIRGDHRVTVVKTGTTMITVVSPG